MLNEAEERAVQPTNDLYFETHARPTTSAMDKQREETKW